MATNLQLLYLLNQALFLSAINKDGQLQLSTPTKWKTCSRDCFPPQGCHWWHAHPLSVQQHSVWEPRCSSLTFHCIFFHTILAKDAVETPHASGVAFFSSRFLKVKQILQIFIPTGSENVFLWLTLSLLNWQMKKMGVRTWGLSAAPLSLMSFHPSFNTKSSRSAVCLSAALLLLLDQLLKNRTLAFILEWKRHNYTRSCDKLLFNNMIVLFTKNKVKHDCIHSGKTHGAAWLAASMPEAGVLWRVWLPSHSERISRC